MDVAASAENTLKTVFKHPVKVTLAVLAIIFIAYVMWMVMKPVGDKATARIQGLVAKGKTALQTDKPSGSPTSEDATTRGT